MKPVYVVWGDAISQDEWMSREAAKKLRPTEIHTLGFLVHEDEECLLVALNWQVENEEVGGHIAIPKGWIRELRYFPELAL